MNQTDPLSTKSSFFAVVMGALICWIILFWAMGKGYEFTDDFTILYGLQITIFTIGR